MRVNSNRFLLASLTCVALGFTTKAQAAYFQCGTMDLGQPWHDGLTSLTSGTAAFKDFLQTTDVGHNITKRGRPHCVDSLWIDENQKLVTHAKLKNVSGTLQDVFGGGSGNMPFSYRQLAEPKKRGLKEEKTQNSKPSARYKSQFDKILVKGTPEFQKFMDTTDFGLRASVRGYPERILKLKVNENEKTVDVLDVKTGIFQGKYLSQKEILGCITTLDISQKATYKNISLDPQSQAFKKEDLRSSAKETQKALSTYVNSGLKYLDELQELAEKKGIKSLSLTRYTRIQNKNLASKARKFMDLWEWATLMGCPKVETSFDFDAVSPSKLAPLSVEKRLTKFNKVRRDLETSKDKLWQALKVFETKEPEALKKLEHHEEEETGPFRDFSNKPLY